LPFYKCDSLITGDKFFDLFIVNAALISIFSVIIKNLYFIQLDFEIAYTDFQTMGFCFCAKEMNRICWCFA
jgi:hypothetical protein